MSIVSTDLLVKLSIKTGEAGNAAAQGDPDASLGKYISTTEISATALNNLFDDVSAVENAASDVEYRCLFLHNAHASIEAANARLYISAETEGGTSIAIGVDTTAASAIGSASAQALETADESTAPSGVSFSSPVTLGTALDLGDIPAGYCRAFWVRRTAANTVAKTNDGATLTVVVETT